MKDKFSVKGCTFFLMYNKSKECVKINKCILKQTDPVTINITPMGKLKEKEMRKEILGNCLAKENMGVTIYVQKVIFKAMKIYAKYYHVVKSEPNLMTDPVHFGRWLLKNAEMYVTDQSLYRWKYNGEEIDTDALYLKFVNEIEKGV